MLDKSLSKSVFLVLLIVLLALGIVPTYGKDASFTKEQVEADLEELYQRLQKAHYNLYVNRSKKDYDHHFSTLKESIDSSMTASEATIFLQRLASFANIAHTKIDLPVEEYSKYRKLGGKSFPLFIKFRDGRAYVTENYSNQNQIKAGDEILKVNNLSISKLIDCLRAYKSADSNEMFYGFLEFQLPMLLWFEFGAIDTYTLNVKTAGGESQYEVDALAYDALVKRMEQSEGQLELGFERKAEILDNIGYLRPGPFFNTEPGAKDVWSNASFKTFIDESFADFIKKDVAALLIDLRVNPGGDSSFSDLMIKKFADKDFKFASKFMVKVSSEFILSNEKRLKINSNGISAKYKKAYKGLSEGEFFEFKLPLNKAKESTFEKPVYVLINRHTYSNAVSVAALIQDYGFGMVLGEETTDLATTYGAMETFNLTNTGITVSFPKAHIIRPNGDKKAHGVTPDIVIKTPLVESEEDFVLQAALKEVGARI